MAFRFSNLGLILKNKFPNAIMKQGGDYYLEDPGDGNGPVIKEWNDKILGIRPTDEELDTWHNEFNTQKNLKDTNDQTDINIINQFCIDNPNNVVSCLCRKLGIVK